MSHPFLESSDATEPQENKFNSKNQVDEDHILNIKQFSIFNFTFNLLMQHILQAALFPDAKLLCL